MERTLWDSPQRRIQDREQEPNTVLREKFQKIADELKIQEEEAKKKNQMACEEPSHNLAMILR